jgi:hypothetical protein
VSLADKLQLKPGQSVAVIGAPAELNLELAPDNPRSEDPADAAAVIVFCEYSGDVERLREPLVAAAERDALAWVSYPKAGQLDTDLNRDILAELLQAGGVRPVRQIAIDDVWSALRVRA